MRRIALLSAAIVLAASCTDPAQPGREEALTPPTFDGDAVVVQVAPPTGDPAIDVPNIEAAVAAATPGAIIQFGRGKYALEPTTQITVSVAGVTLQGHSRGTTIRGFFDPEFLVVHFVLDGGAQTVRGLTFEGFPTALLFRHPGTPGNGYRLEGSTFRDGDLPLILARPSDDVSTIQGNEFINVTLPFVIFANTVHVRGNRITSPKLNRHPLGRPFNAGVLQPGAGTCQNSVLEENTVEGNADGFILFDCRNTVIRRNTFVAQRLFPGDEDFPSFDNGSMVWGVGADFEGNLIEENELRGSPGIGIIVEEGKGNRIFKNTFRDLVPGKLAPFHATLLGMDLAGTGILLGEPTMANRVRENEFHNVANTIVDLGKNNIGKGQGEVQTDVPAGSALRQSVSGEGSRMLDHPKLRVLRERMRN